MPDAPVDTPYFTQELLYPLIIQDEHLSLLCFRRVQVGIALVLHVAEAARVGIGVRARIRIRMRIRAVVRVHMLVGW